MTTQSLQHGITPVVDILWLQYLFLGTKVAKLDLNTTVKWTKWRKNGKLRWKLSRNNTKMSWKKLKLVLWLVQVTMLINYRFFLPFSRWCLFCWSWFLAALFPLFDFWNFSSFLTTNILFVRITFKSSWRRPKRIWKILLRRNRQIGIKKNVKLWKDIKKNDKNLKMVYF